MALVSCAFCPGKYRFVECVACLEAIGNGNSVDQLNLSAPAVTDAPRLSNYDDFDPGWPDWAMWLKVVDAEDVDASHGIYFNQTDQLFQAAIDGQGVALLANVMADAEVAAGRLVQPFSTRLPVQLNYHLVTSPYKAGLAKVCAFREWILEESAYLRT